MAGGGPFWIGVFCSCWLNCDVSLRIVIGISVLMMVWFMFYGMSQRMCSAHSEGPLTWWLLKIIGCLWSFMPVEQDPVVGGKPPRSPILSRRSYLSSVRGRRVRGGMSSYNHAITFYSCLQTTTSFTTNHHTSHHTHACIWVTMSKKCFLYELLKPYSDAQLIPHFNLLSACVSLSLSLSLTAISTGRAPRRRRPVSAICYHW